MFYMAFPPLQGHLGGVKPLISFKSLRFNPRSLGRIKNPVPTGLKAEEQFTLYRYFAPPEREILFIPGG